MNTHRRGPILSPPKQILMQSILQKTITCLTRPAITFFCLPKPVKKNHNTTLPSEEMGNKQATMHGK